MAAGPRLPSQLDAQRLDAVRLREYVAALAACGPRDPGSPGDAASRDYLLRQARSMGLDAWAIPSEVIVFVPGTASLELVSPHSCTIACLPQDRSGFTPSGGIVGRLVYTGLGREEDYAGLDVAGAFALQEIWGLHMTAKVANAHARGALGCIWIHGHPGGERSAWGLGAEPSPLPVVCISQEDGQMLRELAGRVPTSVKLTCSGETHPGSSDHVLIRAPRQAQVPSLLLLAHRDTTHVSPGANDNGSGCAVVLAVVGALRDSVFPFDLVGVFTAAEEGGGIGARQLAARLVAGNELRPRAAINLDMLAVGGPLRLVTGSATTPTSGFLNAAVREAAGGLGFHVEDYVCPMGLADAGPLLEAGIPATWLFKPDDPRFHTREDTLAHVNPNDLKAAAEVVAQAVRLLAARGLG